MIEMVQTKELIVIEYVTDSEVAHVHMGEIDYGIYTGVLENYIKHYGAKGKKEIMNTLAFLIGEIAKMEVPVKPADCPSTVIKE